MMIVMLKASEFISKLTDIANNYKTLYVLGAVGAPLNESTAKRYKSWYSYNAKSDRAKMIDDAVKDGNVFGFDCVCLVKAVAWGWCADKNHNYGGCIIDDNVVKDLGTEGMRDICTDLTDNFHDIIPGEYLWMQGHCGVYIGDGLAIECTPIWANGVQITAVGNIGTKVGYNTRTWCKHGKLPFVDYTADVTPKPDEEKTDDFEDNTSDIIDNSDEEKDIEDVDDIDAKDVTGNTEEIENIDLNNHVPEPTGDATTDNVGKESEKTGIISSFIKYIVKLISWLLNIK